MRPGAGAGDCGPLGAAQVDAGRHAAALAATGRFGPPEVRTFAWERRYARQEWLDQLPTHSNRRLLPPAALDALLGAVGEAIDRLGGSVALRYETVLVAARRSP